MSPKKLECQGKVIIGKKKQQVIIVANEGKKEVKQKTIIYTFTFDGKPYTHSYS
jgi:hypothetical protein